MPKDHIPSSAQILLRSRVLLRSWAYISVLLSTLVIGCSNNNKPNGSSENGINSTNKKTEFKNKTVFFADVTKESGLDFVHRIGDPKNYFFPDISVAGGGVIDFNRDGLMDLILIDSGDLKGALREKDRQKHKLGRNRLYQQTEPGKFKDVTVQLKLNVSAYGNGVAVGDVNNDGFDDLFFSNFGDDRLFLNENGKSFRDVTTESGIMNPLWATSASFFDFDRDGKLDLFVTNYVSYLDGTNCGNAGDPEDFCGPQVFEPTIDKLFHNVSTDQQVKFEDVTSKMGIVGKKGPGLGVIARDFNQDGFPDVYVANDGRENFLWINQGGKSFQEQAGQLGCAMSIKGEAQAGMGVAEADLDFNGVSDIVVTHLDGETNAAYMGSIVETENSPQLFFSESAGAKGVQKISKPMTGFGVALPDLDNDGDQDMLTVNGRVRRRQREPSKDFWSDYAERNQISLNQGKGKFVEYDSADPFCEEVAVSRGLAVVDFDNDGKLDCLVTNASGKARLYRNIFPDAGNWIGFQVVDPSLNGRTALGAKVKIKLPDGSFRTRTVQTDGSYLSASDPRAHFGLGELDKIENIQITWPDQTCESFKVDKINRYQLIEKGSGSPAE